MIRLAAACVALVAAAACAHVPDGRPTGPPAPAGSPADVLATPAVQDAVSALPQLRPLPDVIAPCARSGRRVSAWRDERNGLDFVLAPAGTFIAGAPGDGLGTFDGAEPRTVAIERPFLVCRTELTVGAARAVGLGRYGDAADDLPATRIDHGEALTICGLLGYDLPTEDEWEWLALGAVPRGEACGSVPSPTVGPTLAPTGSGATNALGLHHTLGNAFEWCRDRTTLVGVSGYPVRGGAFDSEAWRLHPARRDVVPDTSELAPNIGFRPVIRLDRR